MVCEVTSVIRLGAVDNYPIVLHGIAAVLAQTEPDIVLLDLGMPLADAPEQNIARLVANGAKVLLFTAEERPVPIQRAIAAGASGLLLKIDPVEVIVGAVRDVFANRLACSGPLAHALITDSSIASKLSPRQVQILKSISEGLPYKTVAKQLEISEATVREHLSRAVASYRDHGVDPGNSHGLISRARADGHLEG